VSLAVPARFWDERKSPRPGEIVWDDEPGAIIIVGAPGPGREPKVKPDQ
jgi:hypothetical protein